MLGCAMQAVQTIHEARIVHSDLKPANFLMVEGQLKLIDFGIAKAISSDTTSIARESQVGIIFPRGVGGKGWGGALCAVAARKPLGLHCFS